MPRIFDNIDLKLLPALCETLQVSDRSDFCVGYFNLRGWRALDCYIERWSGGDGHCCRLLVGMQRLPEDQLRVALQLAEPEEEIDNQTALRMKKSLGRAVPQPTDDRLSDQRGRGRAAPLGRADQGKESRRQAVLSGIPCTPSSTCFSGPTRTIRSLASWAAAT